MNGWLIAGIVIGVIAALVGLVAMFIHAWKLCEKDQFEAKDRYYLLGFEYASEDEGKQYISIGHETYIASLILGVVAGLYDVLKLFVIFLSDFWIETCEANVFFLLILIGLILVNAIQAIVMYDNKKIAAKKIGLGVYYCLFGFLVGLLLSAVLVIVVIISLGMSAINGEGAGGGSYKLDDGTEVEAEKDIFGFETGRFTEKGLLPGGRKYERTDNDHVIEI